MDSNAVIFGIAECSSSSASDISGEIGEMGFNLILSIVMHYFPQYKESSLENISKYELEELDVLFKNNKRKFFHNKNHSKPRYSLKFDASGEIVLGFTGLPVLLVHFYDRKTGKHLGSKELLSKEMVVPALDKLHTTVGIDGKRTCLG